MWSEHGAKWPFCDFWEQFDLVKLQLVELEAHALHQFGDKPSLIHGVGMADGFWSGVPVFEEGED